MFRLSVTRISGLLLSVLLVGCSDPAEKPDRSAAAEPAAAGQTAAPGMRVGTVVETMDASGYTYVQVDDGSSPFWAAAPAFDVNIGDAVVVPAGMAMQDFHSSALDRDFDVVYFVDGIRTGGASSARATGDELPMGHPSIGSGDADAASGIEPGEVEPLTGGQRIGDLVANRDDFVGRTVSFRGTVVKYNANIMGTNWLHVQDGTGEAGGNDLTVTTDASVRVGDVVVVRGELHTDKDFGFGYAYDVIVEDAEVTVE